MVGFPKSGHILQLHRYKFNAVLNPEYTLLLHLRDFHYIGMKCIRVRCVMHTKIFHTIENGWYDEI